MCEKQRWFLGFTLVLILVGTSGLWMATEVQAQQQLNAYSAKFVCGTQGLDSPRGSNVVRGLYSTTINIHNPRGGPNQVAVFRKKAVIARPQRAREPGPISEFVVEQLPPDGALGVDCPDIRALFPGALPAFIEGFLVLYILAPQELDVVGVYTARHRPLGGAPPPPDTSQFDVESIDVETFNPKRVPFFP
jgi:hypothetical protein